MTIFRTAARAALIAVCGVFVAACQQQTVPPDPLVWAVNIGGASFDAGDGVRYTADGFVVGGKEREMPLVKGSQDSDVYKTYREGAVTVAFPIENGEYDVTVKFAEPDNIAGGERVFDTFIEDERKIANMDIMGWRDGKVHSALSITVPSVSVTDGVLDVRFSASAGMPVIHGLVVRRKIAANSTWKMVWSDEFDAANSLDAEKWNVVLWPARKVNDEDQAYTGRSKNLRVEDGRLLIEAHREDYDDARYTSARINSAGKGDFLYGRFEIRAKLPSGKGTWPAIWMLPSDPYRYSTSCEDGEDWQGSATCDAWPNSGEIDIMEHVGYQMNHVHGTVHNEAYYWLKWEQRKGRILLQNVDQAFHVYALEWTPERIDAFVDGTLYFSYMNEGSGWRAWPYDHPFNLVLNVAVGGQWGRSGGGIDDTVFPQRMEVDYVRVYAR